MKYKIKVYIAVGVIALSGITGVLVNREELRSTNDQITVGALFNMSGFGTFAGEASRDGFLMALEDSAGAGKHIKVVFEDTKSELKTAVSGATKLVSIDKAIVVIGPEWTEFGAVVAPIAKEYEVQFISPWVVAESSFVKPPYYWSAYPSDRSEHRALVEYFSKKDIKKISLVYSNNAWSQINIGMFKEELLNKGGMVVISEDVLDQNTKDYRATIAKIKKENPDLIYSAIATDESYGAFITQTRQILGKNIPLATHSSRGASPIIRDRYRKFLENQIYAEPVESKRKNEFDSKYEQRFGKKPQAPSAAVAYDIVSIVIDAIDEGAREPKDIIEHLKNMQKYEGYSGVIEFDEKGQLPVREAVVRSYDSEGRGISL